MKILKVGLLVVGTVLAASIGHAQTTSISATPGAQGLGTIVTPQPGGIYQITGGSRPGSGANLFYSFNQFSIGINATAFFLNTTPNLTTRNILSRVTGPSISSIYGTIDTSTYGGANFFLINPNGVILGPGASLNVGGSFHVSTAHYIRFPEGGTFCAAVCAVVDPPLSVSDPVAWGFLGPTGSITVEGSFLQVAPTQTLSLVGGDVAIRGGAVLLAPSGRLQVASAAGTGEVAVATLESGATPRGAVTISEGSVLDASGDPVGTVVIRGGQLTVDGAFISAHNFGSAGPPAGSGIDLAATGQVLITNAATVGTDTFADGAGAGVRLSAPTVEISAGAAVTAATSGTGRGGDLEVTADVLRLIGLGTSLATVTQFGGGQGGDMQVTVGRPADGVSGLLEITDGAVLSTRSVFGDNGLFGTGAGNVTVRVDGGTLTLSGGGAIESANVGFSGPGGNVTVFADTVLISGRDIFGSASRINSNTVFAGDGGALSLSARVLTVHDGGTIASRTSGDGRVGNISIEAGQLNVTMGGTIGTHNAGSALPGGNVDITVTGQALISGAGSPASPTGIFTSSSGTTPLGDPTPAGVIALDVGSLDLRSQGLIQSGDVTAQGGSITIVAHGPISISDGAGISSQTFLQDVGSVTVTAPSLSISGGFINTSTLETGRAGTISLHLGTLALGAGGQIVSSSLPLASGAAGNIDVTASQSITIAGASPSGHSVLPVPFDEIVKDARSGIFSTTAGSGPGGNITLRAPQISLLAGGTISASSTGGPTATAGSIGIVFGDLLLMDHASITTNSVLADGGNISITSTGSLIHLIDSQITTSVQSGVGGGGNITIGSSSHPIGSIVLDNSGIHADAFGGPGGNINIFANVLLSSTPIDLAITASSALSSPGSINLDVAITDVSGSLAELPSGLLEATALLRSSCAARVAQGKASSLVLAGREGVPPEPGGALPSPLPELRLARAGAEAADPPAVAWPTVQLAHPVAKCGG